MKLSQEKIAASLKDEEGASLVRPGFEAWAKKRALDLTETLGPWGERIYIHSHVESLWCGWLAASQALRSQADALSGESDACPICAVAFRPEDMCLTDIEMGICHAACLEGAPMVDLETGDPLTEGEPPPIPYRYVDEPEPIDLVKRLRALVILDEVGSDNPLGREAATAIERLTADLAASIEERGKMATTAVREVGKMADKLAAAEAQLARQGEALKDIEDDSRGSFSSDTAKRTLSRINLRARSALGVS